MKLSALGEEGIFLMATSSQIERHRVLKEIGRRRRMRGMKLCAVGEGAQ